MIEQITISIPQNLYRRARDLANKRNQPVNDLLEAAITLAEAAMIPTASQEKAMAQEVAAYQSMLAELVTQYDGAYVAIYQGQLVDHDADELALLRRLDAHYPDEIVLMKQVRAEPLPELRIRSPRFVKSAS